jgi:hypothetical protein
MKPRKQQRGVVCAEYTSDAAACWTRHWRQCSPVRCALQCRGERTLVCTAGVVVRASFVHGLLSVGARRTSTAVLRFRAALPLGGVKEIHKAAARSRGSPFCCAAPKPQHAVWASCVETVRSLV